MYTGIGIISGNILYLHILKCYLFGRMDQGTTVTDPSSFVGSVMLFLDTHWKCGKHTQMKNKISGCVNQPTLSIFYGGIRFTHKKTRFIMNLALQYGSPTWARTTDTRINSPLLYQLSYWGIEAYSTDLTPMGQH